MIVFRCPNCGEQLDVPTSSAGQTVSCPNCSNVNLVPAAASVRSHPRCSRVVYIILGIFLGALGIHNFVAGYHGRGISQLLITLFTGWLILPLLAVWIWVLIEVIITTHDANGVRMT